MSSNHLNRKRLLVTEPDHYSEDALDLFNQHFDVEEGPLGRPELLERIGEFEIVVIRLGHRFDRELLQRAKRLKVLVTPTTGLNHIDLELAREQGIDVLSLKGEREFLDSIWATAEHTWALLLGLMRHLPGAAQHVRDGGWNRDAFVGSELHGRNLGVWGYGRVGRKVGAYGQAFGMHVRVFDNNPPIAQEGIEIFDSIREFLAETEVLTIHVPLDESTEGLVGQVELAALPDGAVLINTARGEIVDEEALVAALESGRLAAAALDVVCHELEPARRKSSPVAAYLRDHDNLLVTPHIAGATTESMRSTERFMAQKLVRFLGRRNLL